jgi:putative Ca2+/H+ antiporter (TMEM165/GDT1 family)
MHRMPPSGWCEAFGIDRATSCIASPQPMMHAGVAGGAIAGHAIATLLAVLGGAIASKYMSEKTIGYLGGTLFLAFAAATLLGVY